MNHTGTYPENWDAIATEVKRRSGWKCERCGHVHDRESGHVLTVHHLDGNKSNCWEWNLAALCQRCHLSIQGRVDFSQVYMFEYSPWMQKHVDAFNTWRQTECADHEWLSIVYCGECSKCISGDGSAKEWAFEISTGIRKVGAR